MWGSNQFTGQYIHHSTNHLSTLTKKQLEWNLKLSQRPSTKLSKPIKKSNVDFIQRSNTEVFLWSRKVVVTFTILLHYLKQTVKYLEHFHSGQSFKSGKLSVNPPVVREILSLVSKPDPTPTQISGQPGHRPSSYPASNGNIACNCWILTHWWTYTRCLLWSSPVELI